MRNFFQPFNTIARKMTLQTLIGGLGTYVTAKQAGANDTVATATAIAGALTSLLATGHGGSASEGQPKNDNSGNNSGS